MSKRVWQCDSCKGVSHTMPWNCPGCDKETCDSCFDMCGHCKPCSEGKNERDLIDAANKAGFDFIE